MSISFGFLINFQANGLGSQKKKNTKSNYKLDYTMIIMIRGKYTRKFNLSFYWLRPVISLGLRQTL